MARAQAAIPGFKVSIENQELALVAEPYASILGKKE